MNQTKKLTILGSTGSIGTSTLDIVSKHPDKYSILSLVGGDNLELLSKQVLAFEPQLVVTRTQEGKEKLSALLSGKSSATLLWGQEGAEEAASLDENDVVVSAIVGSAGLRPTMKALEKGKVVALANKESMVVAGALMNRKAKESGATILPVDSEHSAIFQSLQGAETSSVKRLILTASGGPFFQQKEKDLSQVTRSEALNHPNWSMGAKITIDSATMMNKGLEVIEAFWLFGLPVKQINVIVHPQSIVHSMVEYVDGSTLAQLGIPDMRGPIAYALSYPERLANVVDPVNFAKVGTLTFFEPDHERFPSVSLAMEALECSETHPAVLNGANEVTVQAFLEEQIGFLDIVKINREVLHRYPGGEKDTLKDFLSADTWGRNEATRLITK